MTTINNKVSAPSFTPPASRTEATQPKAPAAAAPRAEPRAARSADGFESRPARANFVDRPGQSTFVDRPTGLRPGSPLINPAENLRPVVRPLAARPAAATETLKAEATPNLPVGDLQSVTSTVSFDKDVSIDSLKLSLDLPHTYRGDLVVKLTSPSGKTATVHDRTGGSADDLKGSFDLSAFKGEKAQGTWTLTVEDKARRDTGTLKSWGLEATGQVDGPVEPKPQPTGAPIVAVFDGGVDYKHSDLDGAMWTNPGEIEGDGIDNDGNGIKDDIHGFNVGTGSGDPLKGAGTDHGTHVAGIIAAEDNGEGNTGVAAGKAQVLSVGGLYDGADLLTNFERSVDYVVDMKNRGANIRAVNASFGDEYRDAASQARWKAAVQKLADADILLVAATANGNGSNMNNVQDFPANVDMPNVITVAAMDRNNDKLARFSSHGDKVVELAAVGEDVLSTVPGGDWEKMSGTSMATPRVAATAALMFAENPKLTAAQVRDMLVKTVEVDSDLKGKVSTGGKLDIAAAVAAAKAAATASFAARG
ncbi:MAG: S8 family serine peptidase [Myxococcaceae bacterium]|nr:S8 family serine peptidase [Myxococcaceae bacterium]